MKLTWTNFSGVRPKADPRLLPDGNAQIAQNVSTERGGLRPVRGARFAAALAKSNVKSIYRFGQALASETQFWFHWSTDVDVVKGAINDDTDERTYWTGDGAPKYTKASLGTGGSNLPSASRPLGVPAPITPPILAGAGTAPEGAGVETRVYIYTFVTDDGAESAPSPPATINITIGQSVNLSSLATTASNGAVLQTKRIYRAQRGQYLFVAEIAVATTTHSDTLASDALGEVCPSVDWDLPSATMKALTGGPNGMMAAIDGYTVRFSAPWRPHAWPMSYSQTVGYPCVGVGQFADSFVVLTTGVPYLITGTHPGALSMAPADMYQPCISKRSIVSAAGSVIWASPDGLVALGIEGEHVLTADLFTAQQWRDLRPETIVGEWHEGWYVGSHNPGSGLRGFMFRPATREWIDIPWLRSTAMYRDTVGDALFVCIDDDVYKFADGGLQAYTWRSSEAVTPLADFVAARVTGDYPVTFRLFRDAARIYEETVVSDEPFKVPDGLGRSWSIELEGLSAVLGAVLSTTEADL